MDTGSFYAGYGHSSSSSFVPRHGQSSHQILTSYSMNRYDPAYVNQISIEQKLDRLTKLVEEQTNETAESTNKFVALKDEVDRHIRGYNSCFSSTPSTPGPSKRLPLELSAAVRNLQEKGPEDLKFAGDMLYGSKKNHEVKNYMVTELSQQFANVHSPKKN